MTSRVRTGRRLVPLLRGLGLALAFTALAAAILLVVSTSRLHYVASRLTSALEVVYLAAQAERALVEYNRSSDVASREEEADYEAERTRAEGELDDVLARLDGLVESSLRSQQIAHATSQVRAYMDARKRWRDAGEAADQHSPPRDVASALGRAEASLTALINEKQALARSLQRDAAVENSRGNTLGWLVSGSATLLVGAVWYLLNCEIRAPFARMKRRLEAIEAGSLTTLPLDGPAELREIAHVFNQLVDELRQHHDRQLRFVASIAHDLRAPLNAISISTQLFETESLPKDGEESVMMIRRQVGQLERQLGDLLDTARIEAGRLELRMAEHEMGEIVESAAAVFRHFSERHTLRVEKPNHDVPYRCDGMRIGQVLTNLLSNAIKYSPSGGRVTIALSVESGAIKISLSDEGIGISAEDLPHIFEPFRRTASTREAIPGVGLGLSVSRRIVEAHGGTLEATSIPASGSTFTICLPKRPADLRTDTPELLSMPGPNGARVVGEKRDAAA